MGRGPFYTYFLTNRANTVIYTGVTNDIRRRLLQHRDRSNKGFTGRYQCHKLVYWEEHTTPEAAIKREKQLKAGPRKKKVDLINQANPDWKDLSEGWYD